MSSVALEQAANIVPPRRGQIIALTVDNTARSYDLSPLTIGPAAVPFPTSKTVRVFLNFLAETNDVYFALDNASSATINDATVISAGGTMAYNNAYCARIPKDQATPVRVEWKRDQYLQVKAASASATLRFWFSSEPCGQ